MLDINAHNDQSWAGKFLKVDLYTYLSLRIGITLTREINVAVISVMAIDINIMEKKELI